MEKQEEISVLNTEKVQEILNKEKLGLKLKRSERLWLDNIVGVRRPYVNFQMTEEELQEYIKCKTSIFYFAENYCKVKREDGRVGQIQLRDYQKDILKLYTNNRYSILMASRQSGKCVDFNTIVTIKNNDIIEKIAIGELYYRYLSLIRPLNKYEKIKLFLYKILKYL